MHNKVALLPYNWVCDCVIGMLRVWPSSSIKPPPYNHQGMLSKPCTVPSINTSLPMWQTGDWSTCSAQCNGGTSTRRVVCRHIPTQRTLSDQACQTSTPTSLSTPKRPPSSRPCNSAPCILYTYRVGAWSACSAACGGGVRTRSVECVDPAGNPATDCRGIRPPSQQTCNIYPCAGACGHCSGRGTCDNNRCRCRDGWTGRACETPPMCGQSQGRLDGTGACCQSGRVDIDGRCCGTQPLDGEGRCCGTTVDKCGVCGGRGVLDIEGRCCEGGQLDAQGACCENATVDECGVCDGDGTSCGVVLEMAGDTSAARGAQVLESVVVGLTGAGAILPVAQQRPWTVLLLTGIVGDMGRAARAWPQATVARKPVCGNGVCELDEVGGCAVDCPLPWRECDCAAGGCLVATGTCVCWVGYEGARCEQCAPGFARDGGGDAALWCRMARLHSRQGCQAVVGWCLHWGWLRGCLVWWRWW